ncbi:MAG: YqgE/AlgH family protein [Bacteroidales bacterium]
MEIKNYSDIYKIKPNKLKPLPGNILVANPIIEETYFNRSVICLIENDDKNGAMGLVLNKPMPFTLNSVFDKFNKLPDIPVYCGGPIGNDRLLYLHNLGGMIADSLYISDGISVGGDILSLISYISAGNKVDGYIKFFLGYSGWNSEQLQMEIKTQSWGVGTSCKKDLLTADGEPFWRRSVENLGEGYSPWLKFPYSPMLN